MGAITSVYIMYRFTIILKPLFAMCSYICLVCVELLFVSVNVYLACYVDCLVVWL